MGSTYSGIAGAWSSSLYVSTTGATSVVGTNGATFYITGVQLEVGTTATNFDYRSYGQELALAQRYYQLSQSWTGIANASTGCIGVLNWGVLMRAIPTIGVNGQLVVTDGYSNDWVQSSGAISQNYMTVNNTGAMISFGNLSGLTAYRFMFVRQSNTNQFTMSAEL